MFDAGRNRFAAFVAGVFFSFTISQASAIGILIPRIPQPPPPVPYSPIQLADAQVRVDINQNLAKTRVVQDFFNPNPRQLEADFYFPVPRGADVTDFVLYMNGKPVKGEVLEKDKAREIYEGIVRQMKDPGLLEWMDHNLFKVRVFPVPANGTQKIELEFAQPLEADQGMFKYAFPLKGQKGVFERPSGRGGAAVDFVVNITSSEPVRNVYSPSHAIDSDMKDPKQVKVSLPGKSLSGATGDFVLFYEVSSKDVTASLLASRTGSEDGFFSLMLSPPVQSAGTTAANPGDVVFVIDTSGSMLEDNKIDQARRALNYCVSQLRPDDRFDLIRFSTEVEKFREGLIPASPENLEAGKKWISQLQGRGGTNISGALKEALEMRGTDQATSAPGGSRIYTVVFVTDGLPTVGTTNVDQIVKEVGAQNRENVRLFTFGVGNDVNTKLLDRIAEDTRAVSDYIRPGQDMEVVIGKFFDKISRPAMTGLKLELPGADVYDLYPARLPDLFFGTQLTVFGRYKKAGPTAIKLTGTVAGKPTEHVFEKTLADSAPDNDFVEKLWGTRKIAYLLDEIREHGESSEVKQEVITLAKKYGVATPYTSFLVTEDVPHAPPPRPAVQAEAPRQFGMFKSEGETSMRARASIQNGARTSSGGRYSMDAGVGRTAGASSGPQPMEMAAVPAASATPGMSAESGARAVQRSTELRKMREAVSVAPADKQDDSGKRIRSAAGRTFRHESGVWIDTGLDDAAPSRIIKIKYLSKAYFSLLATKPELKDALALGDAVRVKLDNIEIYVSEEGAEELSAEDRSALKLP